MSISGGGCVLMCIICCSSVVTLANTKRFVVCCGKKKDDFTKIPVPAISQELFAKQIKKMLINYCWTLICFLVLESCADVKFTTRLFFVLCLCGCVFTRKLQCYEQCAFSLTLQIWLFTDHYSAQWGCHIISVSLVFFLPRCYKTINPDGKTSADVKFCCICGENLLVLSTAFGERKQLR